MSASTFDWDGHIRALIKDDKTFDPVIKSLDAAITDLDATIKRKTLDAKNLDEKTYKDDLDKLEKLVNYSAVHPTIPSGSTRVEFAIAIQKHTDFAEAITAITDEDDDATEVDPEIESLIKNIFDNTTKKLSEPSETAKKLKALTGFKSLLEEAKRTGGVKLPDKDVCAPNSKEEIFLIDTVKYLASTPVEAVPVLTPAPAAADEAKSVPPPSNAAAEAAEAEIRKLKEEIEKLKKDAAKDKELSAQELKQFQDAQIALAEEQQKALETARENEEKQSAQIKRMETAVAAANAKAEKDLKELDKSNAAITEISTALVEKDRVIAALKRSSSPPAATPPLSPPLRDELREEDAKGTTLQLKKEADALRSQLEQAKRLAAEQQAARDKSAREAREIEARLSESKAEADRRKTEMEAIKTRLAAIEQLARDKAAEAEKARIDRSAAEAAATAELNKSRAEAAALDRSRREADGRVRESETRLADLTTRLTAVQAALEESKRSAATTAAATAPATPPRRDTTPTTTPSITRVSPTTTSVPPSTPAASAAASASALAAGISPIAASPVATASPARVIPATPAPAVTPAAPVIAPAPTSPATTPTATTTDAKYGSGAAAPMHVSSTATVTTPRMKRTLTDDCVVFSRNDNDEEKERQAYDTGINEWKQHLQDLEPRSKPPTHAPHEIPDAHEIFIGYPAQPNKDESVSYERQDHSHYEFAVLEFPTAISDRGLLKRFLTEEYQATVKKGMGDVNLDTMLKQLPSVLAQDNILSVFARMNITRFKTDTMLLDNFHDYLSKHRTTQIPVKTDGMFRASKKITIPNEAMFKEAQLMLQRLINSGNLPLQFNKPHCIELYNAAYILAKLHNLANDKFLIFPSSVPVPTETEIQAVRQCRLWSQDARGDAVGTTYDKCLSTDAIIPKLPDRKRHNGKGSAG